jgi:TolB-like protein
MHGPVVFRRIRFGRFGLDARTGELTKDGVRLRVPDQSVQILQALIERAGDIVTREELRGRLWPAGTFVDFEHGLNSAVRRLRETLGDSADEPNLIETLPRRGYRFIGVVEPAKAEIASGIFDTAGPSVAVLPFVNMSRDRDDEWSSDGLAEEIINALAQVSGLRVIARTSAFAYKGQNIDVRHIAAALGVTSVLYGSVRKVGTRIRVTARLASAADGSHLWSERYDRELGDVFAVPSLARSR